ncbi:hypothetical protein AQJ27_19495 [Streptomyces olivochromogenes]|uniref:LysR family transcriptional regulator n=1 Tax=Streptomyces olivochromogenes TaxID=1963 RepID=A0A250V7U0_STROL|nr:hypothetical protein AQJ27_19495 [Streptomyces olivochromogenes]GAX50235.1 LysR family transcriptional regulator [Streptomyces olivochromogenes]
MALGDRVGGGHPFAGREAEAAEAYELLGAGVVMRELAGDRPHRHVVAAVRRGAEEGAAVGRVLEALREAAAGLGERR